jgi:hypothetical protein
MALVANATSAIFIWAGPVIRAQLRRNPRASVMHAPGCATRVIHRACHVSDALTVGK